MLYLAKTFAEDIERNFRNHLPREAVAILIAMSEQMLMMEKAINDQQAQIAKLMKFAVLSAELRDKMQRDLDKMQNKYGEQYITTGDVADD